LQDERSKDTLKESMLAAKRSLESIEAGKVLDEVAFHRLSLKYGSVFEAEIGAEAIYNLCRQADLDQLLVEVAASLEQASALERPKLQKRYNLIKSMKRSNVRPEWMFLMAVPVIPPDLRPMVALDGGRHATSDVNDLYRRVINRNNRLKKLQELAAPEVILRNEKRILQEAVDALVDNSMRRSASGGATSQAQRRPLKSLSDGLKGKQGRFRQNLLGKRVDYSGRSVIVVGPELKIDQCGLPKHMALELFRPFIIAKILERESAFNIRGAGRLIDDKVPEVWAILEEVIRDKYVLLNRAPTLHRLGIQAFKPVLIEGNAIQVHPLVCSAFNADFDGDQMAVHIPLSEAAQREARELMAANHNILKPGNGNPIVNLKLDIILGCYWVTTEMAEAKGEGKIFESAKEAIIAYNFNDVDLRAKIKFLADQKPEKYGELAGTIIETSVGRLLFNDCFPADFPFINKPVGAKEINVIVEQLIQRYGINQTLTDILDGLKTFGFRYATRSGTTWGIDDVRVPEAKAEIIATAKAEAHKLEEQYQTGLLSKDERHQLAINLWTKVIEKVRKTLVGSLDPEGSVSYMLQSGARGSATQIGQMAGMKGLIVNPAGQLIDFPIVPSYKDGLSPLEYFISSHGSRKGLTDTALNTAKAGYLTRRLVYVSEDMVITGEDCGDKSGKLVSTAHSSGFDRGIARLIRGRFLTEDLKAADGTLVARAGELVTNAAADLAEKQGIKEARIRTVLTCRATRGICQKCYGLDLGRGHLVNFGEPVGIVAAQAIGEPGTQLTMRTKHAGGVDVGGDIVGGLPRVEEIFERRLPKLPAIISEVDGVVTEIKSDNRETVITILAEAREGKGARAKGGSIEYQVPLVRDAIVREGDTVKIGQLLTDGPADLQQLFKLAGKDVTEEYVISEINKPYELQGTAISRKHLEIIVRQMFSRRKVRQAGDTTFEVGDVVDANELARVNEEMKASGGKEATGDVVLLGISEVSLTTPSFIAAVAFGQSTRVLIKTAIRGGLDHLRGLKENVILGRLIPAGTGLKAKPAPEAAAAETIVAAPELAQE
jgi:DNA-directed RNA polymerase subunit beta'